MSYESNYSGCEVFEIPANVYVEYFCIPEIRELPIYKTLSLYTKKKENEQSSRYDRSRLAMKSMVTNPSVACQSVKVDILSVLHNMVTEAGSFSLHMTTDEFENRTTISMFDNDDNVRQITSRSGSRPNSRSNSPNRRSNSSPTSRLLESRGSPSKIITTSFAPSREAPSQSTSSPRKTVSMASR